MVKIKGTYQGRNRFASFEAHQLDEGWENNRAVSRQSPR